MGTINDLINRLEAFSNDVSNLKGASASILPNSNGMLEKECANESCLSHSLLITKTGKTY